MQTLEKENETQFEIHSHIRSSPLVLITVLHIAIIDATHQL